MTSILMSSATKVAGTRELLRAIVPGRRRTARGAGTDEGRQVRMGMHSLVNREGRTGSGTDLATTSPFSSEIPRKVEFRYPYANLHLWGI
jgi:hypothetical protein